MTSVPATSPKRPALGFVMVTHQAPEQILLLCRRLTAMFDAPPIAIHHDFSQAPLERCLFPENVRFVEDWVKTGWGTIGVVDALLSAVRLIYAGNDSWGDPEWITSLSSADYPIKTAPEILKDLAGSPFDGYLDSRQVKFYPGPFLDAKLGEYPFQQPRYHQFAFNRYMARPLLSISMARRFGVAMEAYCLRSRWVVEHTSPFHDGTHCFAGDAWMTVRRRVAQYLVTETPFWTALRQHLRKRQVPEECFYQTLLGNTKQFTLSTDNLRFTDWKDSYAHPRTLGRNDFSRLLASHAHFARKLPLDPALLYELDKAVAASAPAASLEGCA